MSRRDKKLRRVGGIAVIGLLCAVGAFVATSASAATWTGTTHGKIERSSRLVSGGTSWEGDFWFRTYRGGAVRGQAVVAFEPEIDVSGLNNVIDYIRSIQTEALGLLGDFAPVVGQVGLGQIVGVDVAFQSAKAVRRGRLSGSLRDGRLTLRWDPKLAGIPYDIEFKLVAGSQRIGGGRAALRNPFRGAADVVDRRHAVNSAESRSQDGGVEQTVGSYLVAQRKD